MHCTSCAKIIQDRLLEFEGVEKATVSYADEKAEITFDPQKTSLGMIKETLLELGYNTADSNGSSTALIGIIGMKDENSERQIKNVLSKIDGVEKVKVDYKNEKVEIVFNAGKVSLDDIEEELLELDYDIEVKKASEKKGSGMSLKQGIVYGLVPHIGCIGFIAASVLGVTVAVEFFKPLLMNPWFFHILILIAIGFATFSSGFYLRKQGLFSFAGIKRKKKYLATMYGTTVGINLILFLLIFPLLANIDTGSFAGTSTGAIALAGETLEGNSLLRLQVNIPCPGHAPLISGELKTIEGVTGVRFDFPNFFDVAFDSDNASKEEILGLEVFETYPASLVSETNGTGSGTIAFEGIKEVEGFKAAEGGGSCGGSCGSSSCGSSKGGSCGGGCGG